MSQARVLASCCAPRGTSGRRQSAPSSATSAPTSRRPSRRGATNPGADRRHAGRRDRRRTGHRRLPCRGRGSAGPCRESRACGRARGPTMRQTLASAKVSRGPVGQRRRRPAERARRARARGVLRPRRPAGVAGGPGCGRAASGSGRPVGVRRPVVRLRPADPCRRQRSTGCCNSCAVAGTAAPSCSRRFTRVRCPWHCSRGSPASRMWQRRAWTTRVHCSTCGTSDPAVTR